MKPKGRTDGAAGQGRPRRGHASDSDATLHGVENRRSTGARLFTAHPRSILALMRVESSFVAAIGVLTFAANSQAQSASPRFDATQASVAHSLCAGRARCSLESVLAVGPDAQGAPRAVVRIRVGPSTCQDQRPYRDWLVRSVRGRVQPLRELVRGDLPCLEWHPTHWTLAGGTIVFHHGGMGAPYDVGSLGAERAVHLSLDTLTVVAHFAGAVPLPLPLPSGRSLPARGPLLVLSMEHESALY